MPKSNILVRWIPKFENSFQDLKIRLDEVASNEEKVTEINLELKQQIKEMMQDFDSDKRIALNK